MGMVQEPEEELTSERIEICVLPRFLGFGRLCLLWSLLRLP
jgi:hypothetical protein